MKVFLGVALLLSSTMTAGPPLLSPGAHSGPSEPSLKQDTTWLGRVPGPLVSDFSFEGWRPLAFGGDRGETVYQPGLVAGKRCLRASAQEGGSGLIRPLGDELGVDLETASLLGWSWFVDGPVPGGDLTRKEGDDFAARVYVNFRFQPSRSGFLHRLKQRLANRRFGGEAPGKALVYIWGNLASPGTVARSAYTDQAALIVLRSGTDGAGVWWTETRDFRADFQEAFGEEAPEIHSVAIMTDADDTNTSAAACYGDIFLLDKPGGPQG